MAEIIRLFLLLIAVCVFPSFSKAGELNSCSIFDAVYKPHFKNSRETTAYELTIKKNPDFVKPSGIKAFFVVKSENHPHIDSIEFALKYVCFTSGLCVVDYGASDGGFNYVSAFDHDFFFSRILSEENSPEFLYFPESGDALNKMNWQKSQIFDWKTKQPINDQSKVSLLSLWKFSHCLS